MKKLLLDLLNSGKEFFFWIGLLAIGMHIGATTNIPALQTGQLFIVGGGCGLIYFVLVAIQATVEHWEELKSFRLKYFA